MSLLSSLWTSPPLSLSPVLAGRPVWATSADLWPLGLGQQGAHFLFLSFCTWLAASAQAAKAGEAEAEAVAGRRDRLKAYERQLQEEIERRLQAKLSMPFYLRDANLGGAGLNVTDQKQRTNEAMTRSGASGGVALPNLFNFKPSMKGGDESDVNESPPRRSCKKAFAMFYEQSFATIEPKPTRVVKKLAGNASASGGWDHFFNPGEEGSEGYEACFKQNMENASEVGQGPCAKSFFGKECEYFPEVAISLKFFPACCDKRGCVCECIYQCTNREQLITLLEANVLNYLFVGCSSQIKSHEEGERWKEEQCRKARKKSEFTDMETLCQKNNTTPVCVKQGACVRDICKFCYRWECQGKDGMDREKVLNDNIKERQELHGMDTGKDSEFEDTAIITKSNKAHHKGRKAKSYKRRKNYQDESTNEEEGEKKEGKMRGKDKKAVKRQKNLKKRRKKEKDLGKGRTREDERNQAKMGRKRKEKVHGKGRKKNEYPRNKATRTLHRKIKKRGKEAERKIEQKDEKENDQERQNFKPKKMPSDGRRTLKNNQKSLENVSIKQTPKKDREQKDIIRKMLKGWEKLQMLDKIRKK